MIRALLASAISLIATGSVAQEVDGPWNDYTEDVIVGAVFQWTSDRGVTFWIKEGEIEAPTNVNWVSFWLRGNHARDDRVKFRSSIQRITLLCSSGTYSISAFTSHMADGKIDISEDYRYPASRAIRPDTVIWDIKQKYCPSKP